MGEAWLSKRSREGLANRFEPRARWRRPSVPVPYYDNLEATPIDGLSCLVEVERVYGLDWDRFDYLHWQGLARVYEGLPGAMRLRDVPWCFGDDEDVPPFLWASEEPLGLQVCGILPEADWRAWDERFRVLAGNLPVRDLR